MKKNLKKEDFGTFWKFLGLSGSFWDFLGLSRDLSD